MRAGPQRAFHANGKLEREATFVAGAPDGEVKELYANGAIDTEWEALRAFRGVAEGDMVRFAIPKREPLLVEHERFRDAVEGKSSDIVTLRQGLRTVEVAAAVLESAKSGTTVRVAG